MGSNTRELVLSTHIFCGGAVVDTTPSQEDTYLSPSKDLKSIAYLVQELWCSKVGVANCDTVCSSNSD
jgi:hypothetical protein